MAELFGIFCAAVIGLILYFLFKRIKTNYRSENLLEKEVARQDIQTSLTGENGSSKVNQLAALNTAEVGTELTKMKVESFGEIAARHQDAAKITKKIVDDIYKQDKNIETRRRELKRIDEELDELLKDNKK